MSFSLSSIRAKMGLIVVAGVVSAVLMTSLASAWRETNLRIADKEAELNAIGEALAVTLSQPMAQGNAADATRALRAIGRMPAVKYARAVKTNGTVVANLGVSVILQGTLSNGTPLSSIGILPALSLKHHAFSIPIVASGQQIGRLDLVVDISALSEAFWHSMSAALLSAFIAAVLGLLVATPLLGLVTGPIASLTSTMRAVRKTGDYAVHVTRRSNDETGQLVDAFNDMLREIRSRDQRLEQHRQDLEHQIAARTVELAAAKQVAESASAAKSDFLASMSHEIRTPMHGMLAMTELLQTTTLDERQRHYAGMISKSGRSLMAIVDDILDLSKIEAGRMHLEAVPLNPASVARDVAELFADRAEVADLGITVRCSPQIPTWMQGDPTRLTQILSNLVSNAIKFTPSGGIVIAIEMHKDGDGSPPELKVSVSDTGIGIPRDNIGKLFEAFVQADSTTTRKFGGTGIGLAICKRLVNAMGGTIGVESRVGIGSTFWFVIPVQSADAPIADADVAKPKATSFSGIRALAADDNTVNRSVIFESLARLGVEVTCVEHGQAAVEAFQSGQFDVVYMDCSMPVLDGFEATRRIRAWETDRGRKATPVIALTAHVIGSQASAWRDAGMSDYITKPFSQAELAASLSRWTMPLAVTSQTPTDTSAPAGPSAARPTPDPSVIDADVIGPIIAFDRDGSILEKIVSLFKAQCPTLRSQLAEALAGDDQASIARQAHALKSMCLTIGARRVADLASGIEAAPDRHARNANPAALASINDELDAAIAALDAQVKHTALPQQKLAPGSSAA